MEPPMLPKGVCEIMPHLYIGPSAACKELINKYKLRYILRCMDEPFDYKSLLPKQHIAEHIKAQQDKDAAQKKFWDDRMEQAKQGIIDNEKVDEQPDNTTNEANAKEAQSKSKDHVVEHSESSWAEDESRGQEESTAATTMEEKMNQQEEKEIEKAVTSMGKTEVEEEVQFHVYHCPLPDDLEFQLPKIVPAAVDWLDRVMNLLCDADEGQLEPAEDSNNDEEEGTYEKPKEEKPMKGEDQTGTTNAANVTTIPPLDFSHSVYVHCNAGTSRSPTIVMAYLMTRKNMSLKDIMALMPPTARPNPSFLYQLVQLEQDCRGEKPSINIEDYFLEGLEILFPDFDSTTIAQVFQNCSKNIVKAREVLMKKKLQLMAKKAIEDAAASEDGSAPSTVPA